MVSFQTGASIAKTPVSSRLARSAPYGWLGAWLLSATATHACGPGVKRRVPVYWHASMMACNYHKARPVVSTLINRSVLLFVSNS